MNRYTGRGRGGLLRRVLCILVAAALCFGFVLEGLIFSGARDHVSGTPDTLVVLGAKVLPDGRPSILLQDRLDKALDYWRKTPDCLIVVSGGQGANEPCTEAACMADYLKAAGVDAAQILLEDRSRNTRENLLFTKALLEERGMFPGQTALVSNGFHLFRARMLAKRYGYGDVSALAAPSSHLPARLKSYLREPLALVKSFCFD